MSASPLIFGCSGPELTSEERDFFRAADPLGFILFSRNIVEPRQVRELTGALRDAVGRDDAPILIDQEGGRVARLKPPHWRLTPPAAKIGAVMQTGGLVAACEAARLNALVTALDLAALGVDVDCAPVADVPTRDAHDIIGDRAYGDDPQTVARLARAVMDGLLEGGVLPVIKHIPGHGRARADSHAELPVVDADRAALEHSDFAAFRALADAPWAMTAHVLYTSLDRERPATTSARVIEEVIRGHIGFGGVLVSDDLSMKALEGGLGERARGALDAGCDLALHCTGVLDEMKAIAAAARPMSAAAARRIRDGAKRKNGGKCSGDRHSSLEKLNEILGVSI